MRPRDNQTISRPTDAPLFPFWVADRGLSFFLGFLVLRLSYFSFATLTSVSYGDAYPIHRVARSMAMAEALIGQLYPPILIATLVGMALQARSVEG